MGDFKYGSESFNRVCRERYGLKHQLLHAYRLEFPQSQEVPDHLSGKIFFAEPPELFCHILKEEQLEESYYENLEYNMGLCKNDHHCGSGGPDRK